MTLVWVATAPIYAGGDVGINVRAYNPGDIVPDSAVANWDLDTEGLVVQEDRTVPPDPDFHGNNPVLQAELDALTTGAGRLSDASLRAALVAPSVRAASGPLRVGPVAGRTIWPGTANMTDGTVTYGNYRDGVLMTRTARDLRLVYVNATKNETVADLTGLTDITIRAGLEIGSAIVPVFFGGRRSVVIEPGGYAISDPVGVEAAAGTPLYRRTNVSVASGGKWPLGDTANGPGGYAADGTQLFGQGAAETGTGANVDKSTSGSITQLLGGNAYYFAPVAMLGTPADPVGFGPVVGLVADSKGTGTGDTTNPPPAVGRGYFRRAVGGAFPALDLAVGGSKTSDWLNTGLQNQIKNTFLTCCEHIVVDLGTNDFNGDRTWAQTQPDMIAVWQFLAGIAGTKVYATTVIPSTTSTDAWATLAGQTPKAHEADRVACNTWLRDGAPMLNGAAAATGGNAAGTLRIGDAGHPVAALFDFATATESGLNSGLFRIDLGAPTTDGVHPSTPLHIEMGKKIDTALFV